MTSDGWDLLVSRTMGLDAAGCAPIGPQTTLRRCCFCNRSAPAVSFLKDAHAFPVALGNHFLLSTEECDSCNERGSRYEGDLVSVLAMARAVAMVRPRNKSFKVRTGPGDSSVEVHPADTKMIISMPDLSDPTLRARRVHGGLQFSVQLRTFRPANVVKALARAAWFFLDPETRRRYDHLRQLVVGTASWPEPVLLLCDLPDLHLQPVLQVWGRSDGAPWKSPVLDVRIQLGYSAVVAHLPDASWTLPSVRPPRGKGMRIAVDSETEAVRELVQSITLKFTDLAELPVPTHEDIAARAYQRFRERGALAGDAVADWLEAEQDVLWDQLGFAPHERPATE